MLILLDLSKAFDSVNHNILLSKLIRYNIDTFWFKNYLENRAQSVRAGSHISNPLPITYGVPQGSILGPILFNIFTNDLFDTDENIDGVCYADDLQITLSDTINNIPDIKNKAEYLLNKLKKWYDTNGLLVNTEKTQAIFLGTSAMTKKIPKDFSLNFNGSKIYPVEQVKNLGITLDQTLSFKWHIDNICSRATHALLRINRVQHLFNKTARQIAVQSLALSHLNYCSTIWGTCSKTYLMKAERCQNFAIKVISDGHHKKRDSVTPLRKALNMLTFEKLCELRFACHIYKIVNNVFPHWYFQLPFLIETRDRNTRQNKDLFTPDLRKRLGKRTLKFSAPTLWNKIPMDIRQKRSLKIFKKYYLKHLLNLS